MYWYIEVEKHFDLLVSRQSSSGSSYALFVPLAFTKYRGTCLRFLHRRVSTQDGHGSN